MSCPTCSNTMQNLGLGQAGRLSFWCPRCGTVKTVTDAEHWDAEAPALVRRVRHYMAEIDVGDGDTLFNRLGLREAVYPEEERQA